jgi:hypothetical protein
VKLKPLLKAFQQDLGLMGLSSVEGTVWLKSIDQNGDGFLGLAELTHAVASAPKV